MHGTFRKTFSENIRSQNQSMAEDEADEDEDEVVNKMNENVEGEEEGGLDKFNEIGEQIEPFNLREEREQGYFDANENFIWKKETEEPDAWLAGLDEASVERSIGEAAAAQQRRSAQEALIPDVISVDKFALKQELLSYLLPEEGVSSALRRLGSNTKQKSTKKKSSGNEIDDPATRKHQFNRITDIADALLSVGEYDIYSATYEDIEEAIAHRKRRAGDVVSSVSARSEQTEVQGDVWQYMGQDGEVHGPLTTQQILEWRAQGFFTGETAVQMRLVANTDESNTAGDEPQDRDANGDDDAAPRQKRVRFETQPPQSSMHEDLLNDFDEDDDNDAVRPVTPTERAQHAAWHSSDSIPFARFV